MLEREELTDSSTLWTLWKMRLCYNLFQSSVWASQNDFLSTDNQKYIYLTKILHFLHQTLMDQLSRLSIVRIVIFSQTMVLSCLSFTLVMIELKIRLSKSTEEILLKIILSFSYKHNLSTMAPVMTSYTSTIKTPLFTK